MNIGLFFGSFNPIHLGHLIIAESVLNETDLDKVWLIVSPQNPLKDKASLAGEVDRLRMAELAVEGNTRIRASNIEFRLPKPSYTIDTLTHLADLYREHHFSLIMGEDNLIQLPKWKNYQAILDHYAIFIYPRGPVGPERIPALQALHPNVKMFELPYLDISATRIRQMVKMKKSIKYLVPEPVEQYIDANGIYGN